MKATKETLSPTRVKLTVEVPFEELKPSLDAAYRKLAKEVRVAGFRPGKVPPRVLDQRLGRSVVLEQALQDAVPRFYSEAVEAEEIAAISGPDLDIANFADGAPLVFTAEMDVRPTIVLPALDGLEVTVNPSTVTDEQVEAELDKMRDQSAVLEPVDRPVRTGDYVSLDMTATVDGERVDGADAAGLSYEVGSGNLVEGIDDSIVGAAEGESRTFDTKLLAGDLAGHTAQVTVTVRGVKEKKRPDLDDDFVTTASEFDTVAELRAGIRERLGTGRRVEQVEQARDRLIDLLVERVDVPVPASVLAGEIEAREQRFGRELERMGTSREAYFVGTGRDAEEFDAELRALAEKSIKTQLVLDAIIDAEKIGMEQNELLEQIVYRAQRAGVSPELYAKHLSEGEGRGLTAVMADMMRSKAFLVLLEHATVIDSDGNRVDLTLPRGPQVETDEADWDDEDGDDEDGDEADWDEADENEADWDDADGEDEDAAGGAPAHGTIG